MSLMKIRNSIFSRSGYLTAMSLLTALLFFASCALAPTVPDEIPPETVGAQVPEDPFEPVADPYERMSAAIVLGDPQAAISAYEEAKLADPDDPATLVLLANLYIAAGDLVNARQILESISPAEDEAVQADILSALSLIARIEGDTNGEQELLARVLELDPDNVRANTAAGEILLEDEQYDAAEARFSKALEEDPDDFVALQGLGNSFLRNGRSQDAIEVFSRAIEVDPDYSYTYSDRAKAHVEQGDFIDALADMEQAIERERTNGWHYLDRGRMFSRSGRFTEARDDFVIAAELLPDVFLIYAYLAQVHGYLGEYAEAADAFRSALDLRPDYFPAYPFMGALEYISGNYDSAHQWLMRAYESEEANPAYLLFAAAAIFAESEFEGERFLENRLNAFERGTLLFQTARYYVDNVDLPVINALRREENDRLKALGQFYFALRSVQQGRTDSARALLESVEQGELDGSPESLVRDWLINESS